MPGPDEQPYRASVIRTSPYDVEYDNGAVLPRDGFAHNDASIFEGVQQVPAAPMGGYGAGPMTADISGNVFGGTAFGAGMQQAEEAAPPPPAAAPLGNADTLAGIAEANTSGPRFIDPYTRSMRRDIAQGPSGAPLGAPPALAPGPGYVQQPQGYGPPPSGGGASVRSNTTTSTQRGVPVDPAVRGELNFQSAREEQALQDQAGLAGDAAKQRAGYLGSLEQEQERLAAQRAKNEADRQDAMRVAGDDYRRAVQEFEQREVDPNRFFAERGTGATITAAIAMALGAFSQSMTGGPNNATEIIQDAIGRDIDAQKANLQTRQAGVEARGNLLSQMRGRFDDERSAELATESALLRRAETRAQQLEAQSAASGAEVAGELASAQLGQRAAEREAELSAREADRVTTQVQTQRSSGGGGARRREPSPAEMRQYSDRRAVSDRARTVLGRLEGRVAAVGDDDIPGVGATSMLPNVMLTSSGREMRGDLDAMTAEYLHATTGAVASAPEREAAVNVLEGLTDADLRHRLVQMRGALEDADRNLDAGFAPEVLDTYRQRGGGERPQAGTRPRSAGD